MSLAALWHKQSEQNCNPHIAPRHTQQLVGWAWAWPSEKDSPPREWVALEVDTNPVNDPGCSSENKKSYLMFEIIAIMIMI